VYGLPPAAGTVAQTLGVCDGSQKMYWLCIGSHVAWHCTATYVLELVSRLPQQSWLFGHSASLSHGTRTPPLFPHDVLFASSQR
jgi:hypothetical protein